MRALLVAGLVVTLVLCVTSTTAHAASEDADVARLTAQLDQLGNNPELGRYATGQQTLARTAIADLQGASRGRHDHALFMAEQRVALAEAAARLDADRAKLDQLQREHDQMLLEASQADAAAARAELARQRLQYEAAVQQAQMLQEQGTQATQQAEQAQAEAAQAKKLAAAQARAAELARKEAKLAAAATEALQATNSASLQLSPASFRGSSDDLTTSARRRVADFARAHAGQRIVLEPLASSDARVLAGRRAVAVEAALEAAGAGKVSIRPVGHADKGAAVGIRVE